MMECSNPSRTLLQAGDDGLLSVDPAAASTMPASTPWQDSQEIQCLLCLLSAYLLFFGQVRAERGERADGISL